MNEPLSGANLPLETVQAFLPPYVRSVLTSCPQAGGGVHYSLYHMACVLAREGVSAELAAKLIRHASADCGRFVPPDEIQEAIRNAYKTVGRSGAVSVQKEPRPAIWPKPNIEQIEAIANNGPGLRGLEAISPVKFNDTERHTEEIIDRLFRPDDLVCCGSDKKEFGTRTRSAWRGRLSSMPFIVPSPMTALTGLTTAGRKSPRALSNTGPRRFLVIEFDFAEKDRQGRDAPQAPMLRALVQQGITILDLAASLHLHLANVAPLALAVFSGRKSLHGWFYCEGQPDDQVRRFMRYAVSLGADPATWTRNQMVRMPDGTRADGDGSRQTVHFFNPEVLDVR